MTPGQIAYEALPSSPHDRVPWDKLAPHWREYWEQTAGAVDKAARKECARIVATLAERPYDSEPEFSAIMAAEDAILRSIK